MNDEDKTKSAREQAASQMASIAEMVAALECDYGRLQELRDSKTMHYVAGWNMPGYLPDSEPEEFDDADDALEYIKEAAKTYIEEEESQSADTPVSFKVDIDTWKADDNGEFGFTFGNYHYFVTAIGEKSDDDEELADLEEAAGECESREDAEQRIQEDPLSVEVRSGWYSPGGDNEPEEFEFKILLCTGGPAVQIRGELNHHGEPYRAWLEYQDWFTAWIEYHGENADQETLLTYCRQFYFAD